MSKIVKLGAIILLLTLSNFIFSEFGLTGLVCFIAIVLVVWDLAR